MRGRSKEKRAVPTEARKARERRRKGEDANALTTRRSLGGSNKRSGRKDGGEREETRVLGGSINKQRQAREEAVQAATRKGTVNTPREDECTATVALREKRSQRGWERLGGTSKGERDPAASAQKPDLKGSPLRPGFAAVHGWRAGRR